MMVHGKKAGLVMNLSGGAEVLRPPEYGEYLRQMKGLAKLAAASGLAGEEALLSIGETRLGKPILALRLGNPEEPTLYLGGFHAQEWITTLALFCFAREILGGGKREFCGIDVAKALESRGLFLVPAVNLDGIDLVLGGMARAGDYATQVEAISRGALGNWQANIAGVDLNHNYDAGFALLRQMEREQGIDGPAPRQYGGEKPHSEPETRAVVSLCRALRPNKAVAFHSQGEEIFYQYGAHTPKKAQLMAEILAASSGYRLVEQEGLASHGGMKDWFIQEFHRPGFTVELGKGRNPLPLTDLPDIYHRVREMLMLGVIL